MDVTIIPGNCHITYSFLFFLVSLLFVGRNLETRKCQFFLERKENVFYSQRYIQNSKKSLAILCHKLPGLVELLDMAAIVKTINTRCNNYISRHIHLVKKVFKRAVECLKFMT